MRRLLILLGQWRALILLYIEQSEDLVRCYRCLMDSQTDFERYSYSAPHKYKSGALITQLRILLKQKTALLSTFRPSVYLHANHIFSKNTLLHPVKPRYTLLHRR